MSAAPPTSEVAVCNLALARIGQAAISSIEPPDSTAEDKVAQQYPATRRAILRGYTFNFSKKLAQLTASGSETPVFGFSNAFALPNDFIRLLTLGDYTINANTPPSLYEVVEGFIYTDQLDDADDETINVKYIKDVTTISKWDPLALKLLWLQLAWDLAPTFGVNLRKLAQLGLGEELADIKLQAAAISGQEHPPQRVQHSKILARRRRSGFSRDTTRYSV